jgi:hypothetical protein
VYLFKGVIRHSSLPISASIKGDFFRVRNDSRVSVSELSLQGLLNGNIYKCYNKTLMVHLPKGGDRKRNKEPDVAKYNNINNGASPPIDCPNLYANKPMSTTGLAMSEYKWAKVSANLSMSCVNS